MTIKNNDRVIQLILLLIIAIGFFSIVIILKNDKAEEKIPNKLLQQTEESEDSVLAVNVMTVSNQNIEDYIKINGDVISNFSIDIFPDTGGKIVSLPAELGDQIKKGQYIAQIDPSTPGTKYSLSPVESTVSGTITSISVEVGDTVSTGTTIATIGDINDLRIQTYIPEKYVGDLKIGLKANIILSAYPDLDFKAKVTEISPVLDTESRSMAVKLKPEGIDNHIKVGMYATIKLITKESKNTIVIPTSALTTYYGDLCVYVVNQDNTVTRKMVKTGITSDEKAQIIEGLKVGDILVTGGVGNLTDGAQIRAINS